MKQTELKILLPLFILIMSACSFPHITPIAPTSTIGPSPTATITDLPTDTPTPIPTATQVPAALIQSGETTLFNGDYSTARQNFNSAIEKSNDEKVNSAALWGLGKIDYQAGNFATALDILRKITLDYPDSIESPNAWFLLGETYSTLERYQEAAEAYHNYVNNRPGIIDAYVYQKLGDAYYALGEYASSQKAYKIAEISPGQFNSIAVRIEIGNTYLNSGDPQTAFQIFEDISASTTDEYLKAQLDLLSGRALLALGRTEDGYNRWRHAVDNYPMSYDSYSALVGLVDANQPVDDFNRGLVDYYSQKNDVAMKAFQRYLSNNPSNDGTVVYYMAATSRDMGDYKSAVTTWNTFIENYHENRYWGAAWDDRAAVQWIYLNDYESAAKGLEDFTTVTIGSPFSATYLLEAARIYERSDNLEKAANLWESLPARFEGDPAMANSWFQAGITRFRMGNYSSAILDFQQALLLSKAATDRARAFLWLGKSYSSNGDNENSRSALEQAQTADPNGYYSIRARDLLENRAPFTSPPSMNLNIDLTSERTEAASWVRIKFNLTADTDLSNTGALQYEPAFQRGQEFWSLGMYDQARQEFEALRAAINQNPAELFCFGNYLLDIGAYRSGIYALRDLLALSGLDDHSASLTAPAYFTHIRYGLYYSDLVWSASTETSFDPLFVLSVIRQESLFEGFVHSSMGARGLMQIMPATGESIASQMGWPVNYSDTDLYSPYISIRMGTNYLASNRRYLNNDLYATLAGYNSGPGNAKIWQELAKGDLDLELEIIRYSETRDYIRSIYEIFTIYRGLYSPMQ